MRGTFTSFMLLLVTAFPAVAGDVAVFKNLGFSTDGRYFMFGQYGIDGNTKNPYAEIYAVHVPKNDFVPGGVQKGTFPVSISIGDDGQKALYVQLEKTADLRKRLGLDFLVQGRPIYFRVITEQDTAKADNLKVLDYESGREYIFDLKETHQSVDGKQTSSFVINLEIRNKAGDLITSRVVGTPQVQRPGVKNYTIVQAILAPREKGLIIVIEKEEDDGNGGVNIRHMVETLNL